MKKIIKYLGEILLIIGSFITVYNLLNFTHYRYGYLTGLPIDKSYYYTNAAQFMIAIGVVLIVIGILIIRKKKK